MDYIIVTGANGGMGKATINMLIDAGYTVFAFDINKFEESSGVIPICVDVTNSKSVSNAFEQVQRYTNSIKAIIHFAGVYMLDSLVEMSEDRFRKIFDINLNGVYLINKTFMPLLTKNSKIIITTSELANLKPLPFTGIYAITKGALDNYAYSLKMELQLQGIYVSVIRAGAVKTSMIDKSTAELDEFINNTKLYNCNANRFKKIVDSIEAKSISPYKLSKKVLKVLGKKKPKFAFCINRNFLLLLFNILPSKLQFYIIRKVLK